MKNDMSGRFYARVLANIFYSAIVTCLVEIFLVTNVSMVMDYLRESGRGGRFVRAVQSGTIGVLFYVILGIIVFSVLFLLLQKRSLEYIRKLYEAMQNISEGDLNTEVEVIGDDEFSSNMAASLNQMTQDIRSLMDKERESERTKNELITNIAHDLRTPLTSIIGYLELLSVGNSLPPEMEKKYINIAYTKAKRLEKLIEELFGFTKLNCGKISMKVGQVDIIKLLSQLLEEFYPSFMEKNLVYELRSNVSVKVITADGNLLARLFDNLINNAIKYGADGKRIIVDVEAEDTVVTVSVTNFGYVIPEKDLPLLFKASFTGSSIPALLQPAARYRGLAIAKIS